MVGMEKGISFTLKLEVTELGFEKKEWVLATTIPVSKLNPINPILIRNSNPDNLYVPK